MCARRGRGGCREGAALVCWVPEAWAVLAQCVEDGVCDVCTARHTQGLQTVASSTDCDQAFVCDLLLKAMPQDRKTDTHTHTQKRDR